LAKGAGFRLAPDAPQTFPEWIRHRARVGGDKLAVEVGGVARSYAELDDVTDRTAAGFAGLGLASGEHVSLMMQNSVENVDAWFGLQKAGLVEIPIHTASRGAALQYIVDHSDARALVVDEAFLPHLAAVVGDLPRLEHVIVNRNEPGEDPPPELPGRFAVRGIPTLLLFKEGELAETIVGLRPKEDIAQLIERHLESLRAASKAISAEVARVPGLSLSARV